MNAYVRLIFSGSNVSMDPFEAARIVTSLLAVATVLLVARNAEIVAPIIERVSVLVITLSLVASWQPENLPVHPNSILASPWNRDIASRIEGFCSGVPKCMPFPLG